MADSSITGLSAGTALAGTEPIPADQGGVTVKTTPADIKTYVLTAPLNLGYTTLANIPNAKSYTSNGATGEVNTYVIGSYSEAIASAASVNNWGIGVYGTAATNGATRSAGVMGEGFVSATGDTGSSIGVRGYAAQTHAGGSNIGVLGSATGGLTNYDFYSQNGTMISATGTLSLASVLNVPLGTSGAPSITFGGSATTGFYSSAAGYIGTPSAFAIGGALSVSNIRTSSTGALVSVITNPTITSGFGTTPSIVGNGTIAFTITVGTGGTASSGVVNLGGLPAATGWNAIVTPAGAPQAGAVMYAASTSTTTITITNYTASTGVALAWPAGTVLNVICFGR